MPPSIVVVASQYPKKVDISASLKPKKDDAPDKPNRKLKPATAAYTMTDKYLTIEDHLNSLD